jgi:hypothetical protein
MQVVQVMIFELSFCEYFSLIRVQQYGFLGRELIGSWSIDAMA